MANTKNQGRDYQAEQQKMRKQLQNLAEEQMRECDHKPRGNGRVVPISEYKGHLSNKESLPLSTAVCTRCGATFEAESYTREETSSGIYMFNSMLHQIKMNAQLSDEDIQMINNAFDALDTVATVCTYYNNMVDKLSGNNNNKKKNNRTSKGHIGVDTSMFGGRGY